MKPLKTCNACHQNLPLDRFYKDTSKKDGFRTTCKTCFNSKTRICLHCKQTKSSADFSLQAKLCLVCEAHVKRCPGCDTIKPHDEFFSNPTQRGGLDSHCNLCRKDWTNEYRQTEKGRGALLAYREKYYGTEAYKEAQAKYRGSERQKKMSREYHKEYRRRNPNKRSWYNSLRRARQLEAEGSYTQEEFEALCKKYGHRCLCCGVHASETPEGFLCADHIVPLVKDGSNYISNIQPLCKSCNSTKHDKIIDYRSGRPAR